MPDSSKTPACSHCSSPAVIHQRDADLHLCSAHFASDIENRVKRWINEHRLIKRGNRIAIAFSGGKDSTALLIILHRLFREQPDVELIAVTIDEGITGYREETIRAAEEMTTTLGVTHQIFTFTDLFGHTLDTMLAGRASRACTICGILRKRAITLAARHCNASAIATGHNLDDEAQSVLMNCLRGDLMRLIRQTDPDEQGPFIPRIKPLARIPEKEVALYLITQGHFRQLPECPYTGFALRGAVRKMIGTLEYRHPGSMMHLVKSKEWFGALVAQSEKTKHLNRCPTCNEPCSGTMCEVCELMGSGRS